MGSLGSNNSKDEENSKIKESQDDSSYDYELKSDRSNTTKKSKYFSSNEQSDTTENTKTLDINDKKISYKFEWKEGGAEVKIAGSFLNSWTEKVNLKKNLNTGNFEIMLNIPKGINQFKFIVDGKWVCSSFYETIKEKNITNNIIDLKNENKNEINYTDEWLNSREVKKKKKKKIKENHEYNCIFPKEASINDESPVLPFLYINTFDLNNQTQQKKLKHYFDNKYFKFNNSRNKLESKNFKTIIPLNHEKVLHICYDLENNNPKDRFIKTAITQRNKHKFLTIIYYSPKHE